MKHSIFTSKCTKMRLVAGLRPDPLGELAALIQIPSWIKGDMGGEWGRGWREKWRKEGEVC